MTLRAVASMVLLGVVVTGCGSGGSSSSSLCSDYAQLAQVKGTDKATLQKAADLYRKVADEAPASVQSDLRTLADDEEKVAAGHAASVDSNAADAAAGRADTAVTAECKGK